MDIIVSNGQLFIWTCGRKPEKSLAESLQTEKPVVWPDSSYCEVAVLSPNNWAATNSSIQLNWLHSLIIKSFSIRPKSVTQLVLVSHVVTNIPRTWQWFTLDFRLMVKQAFILISYVLSSTFDTELCWSHCGKMNDSSQSCIAIKGSCNYINMLYYVLISSVTNLTQTMLLCLSHVHELWCFYFPVFH